MSQLLIIRVLRHSNNQYFWSQWLQGAHHSLECANCNCRLTSPAIQDLLIYFIMGFF